jgi:hypothetical protein
MHFHAGIVEATDGLVGPGRWCTIAIGASHTAVLNGAHVSLLFLEAWKRWLSPARFVAEARRDVIYRRRK